MGYTRVSVNGLSLLGSQFVEVGTEAALDINEVVLPSADLPGLDDSFTSFQTTLQMWNGSGYTMYGLLGVGQGTTLGVPDWDGKWLTDMMDAVATVDVPAGSGFWVQTAGNSTVTMMGQVASADTTSVDIAAGLNLISCSYPKAINIQDVVASAELPGLDDSYTSFQTTLQIWDGSGYTMFGLLGAGQGTALGVPEWDGKWLTDMMDAVADVEIPAGSGFWIQTTGSGTVTFAK